MRLSYRFALLLPLLDALPAAPCPEFAGLYRPASPRLLVDTRREGDSLPLRRYNGTALPPAGCFI